MKTTFKALAATVALGLSSALAAAPAAAQNASLSQILQRIQTDSSEMSREDQQRVREFQADAAQQERILSEARAELATAQRRGAALSSEFDQNEARLGELQAQIEAEAGDFGELLGQFRSAAGEALPIIRESIASFEYEGRAEQISEIAQARSLPTRDDLDALPNAMLQEMIAQSEVKTFNAPVANAGEDDVNVESAEVIRIGTLGAATTGAGDLPVLFLERETIGDRAVLQAIGTQPDGRIMGQMVDLINAGPDEVVAAPVDPTGGALFDALRFQKSPFERIEDGGLVGQIILVLLAVGAAIGLFKIVSLLLMGMSMRGTARSGDAGTGNPLARVLSVYEENKAAPVETLELKLDEQILQEAPRIDRFNDIVKVLAAVAPLLGLLGTVIGMIITFTAITIFGAGDPQRMADGISVALMTTVLGLIAAIPLLLIHAVASSLARGNQQLLDERAAGLVAERADRDTAPGATTTRTVVA